jgi:hypothetical protein
MRSVITALALVNAVSLIPYPSSRIPYPASPIPEQGFRMRDPGLGMRDQGLGMRDQGLGISDQGLGMRDQGLPQSPSAVIDRIMAVVDGQTITLSDVNAALEFGLIQPAAGTGDPLAFVLDRMIERTLMLAEVERFQPPEPDPIEITIRADAIEKRSGTAAFDKTLSVTGTTREQLRQFIRDDLRITTYLNRRFGDTAERQPAIAAWVSELRRRADITVQYKGR